VKQSKQNMQEESKQAMLLPKQDRKAEGPTVEILSYESQALLGLTIFYG